jgi:hypothetical protein
VPSWCEVTLPHGVDPLEPASVGFGALAAVAVWSRLWEPFAAVSVIGVAGHADRRPPILSDLRGTGTNTESQPAPREAAGARQSRTVASRVSHVFLVSPVWRRPYRTKVREF